MYVNVGLKVNVNVVLVINMILRTSFGKQNFTIMSRILSTFKPIRVSRFPDTDITPRKSIINFTYHCVVHFSLGY